MLAVAASVGTMFAEPVQISDLYYNLDATNHTAEVAENSNARGEIIIPSSVTYNSVSYSVTSIGDYAFRDCYGLTSVTIPNSVTSIGSFAFLGCTGLTSPVYNAHVFAYMPTSYSGAYTIPDGIESIAGGAFDGCTGLTSVTIPNSVTSIGDGAFYYCTGLTSVTIPNSVTSIRGGAFQYCTGLTSVTIPNSVTSIGESTFEDCKGLTSVTIPNSVDSIGDFAFSGCTGLTSVTIPNSVTSIGNSAFSRCTGLTSVTIPNSVTSIGERAFYECTGLTSIDVASDNSNYCSVDGVLFNKDKTTLIQYPGGKQGAYTIPNSVTSIGESAFEGCTGLTSVTIPNSVTSIGNQAFAICTGLISVTIPNSVTSIGSYAFFHCRSLTSVTNFANTPQEIDSYVFDNVDKSTCVLYVPAGSVSAYKSADQWKKFTNILPIGAQPADVTTTTVTPSATTADIAWPQVTGAATYTIEIKINGVLICTLTFNAQGQLISIALAAPSRNNAPQRAQAVGFSFTVTSLDSGTTYSYTMTAKDNNGNVLKTESGTFTTTGDAQGLDEISSSLQGGDRGRLIYHEGQIYIIRGDKTYTLQGQVVR